MCRLDISFFFNWRGMFIFVSFLFCSVLFEPSVRVTTSGLYIIMRVLLQVSALLEVMSVECGLLSRMYMVYFGDLGADNVAAVLLFAKYSITLSSLN